MSLDLLEAEAATTPHASTGPRTAAGKAQSSRNSFRTGLYSMRDFIRPEEEQEYADILLKLMDQLEPQGTLEEIFANEIMGATWRLRRCRVVEQSFTDLDDLNSDPMIDEQTQKQQKSVDRARAQSHNILRRSLAELRKLQANRKEGPVTDEMLDDLEESFGLSETRETSFCESAPMAPAATKSIARNLPCPCGSGIKYKRCCGNPAVIALKTAS